MYQCAPQQGLTAGIPVAECPAELPYADLEAHKCLAQCSAGKAVFNGKDCLGKMPLLCISDFSNATAILQNVQQCLAMAF